MGHDRERSGRLLIRPARCAESAPAYLLDGQILSKAPKRSQTVHESRRGGRSAPRLCQPAPGQPPLPNHRRFSRPRRPQAPRMARPTRTRLTIGHPPTAHDRNHGDRHPGPRDEHPRPPTTNPQSSRPRRNHRPRRNRWARNSWVNMYSVSGERGQWAFIRWYLWRTCESARDWLCCCGSAPHGRWTCMGF